MKYTKDGLFSKGRFYRSPVIYQLPKGIMVLRQENGDKYPDDIGREIITDILNKMDLPKGYDGKIYGLQLSW